MQELKEMLNRGNWSEFLTHVKPKCFVDTEKSHDTGLLAQMCRSLINETTPEDVKIACLKCLGNSCFIAYKHKEHNLENEEPDEYNRQLYHTLAEINLCEHEKDCNYPHSSHFPYDGIIKWTVNFIEAHAQSISNLTGHSTTIYRLSMQFLCNIFSWAYDDTNSKEDDIRRYLSDNFKLSIINSTCSDDMCLVTVTCKFIFNMLESYFTYSEKTRLCSQLLKLCNKNDSAAAKDALLRILYRGKGFEKIYPNMNSSAKVKLLEVIYMELSDSQTKDSVILENESKEMHMTVIFEYLTQIFLKMSDRVLKTVDTYVDCKDCKEIMMILQLLGQFTSEYKISENARSLLINCKYLLMSMHMLGKESNNYFTPITKLSEVAPNARSSAINTSSATDVETPKEHPAYEFKTRLIRVIANMVYENKMCQDLFREIDGIPLLLDCCNIDARNPLIMQWTILALRNLCKDNPENQEVIANCTKKGVVDNSVLREMGLTLHEDADGKSVRVAPLRRD